MPDLTETDLLAVPIANLLPGELSRAFLARAADNQKKDQLAEQQFEVSIATRKHEDDQREQEHEELAEREAVLLGQISRREQQLREEAEELDKRTIKLADGRRAYVDGDKYRDAEGRELEGADRAEAEQHHLEQPHAATWQEQQTLTAKIAEAQKAREQVEALQAGKAGPNEAQALSGLEQRLQTATTANLAVQETAPDFGSGDYMSELGGLSANFNQAGSGAPATPAGSAPTITTQPVVTQSIPPLRQRV